MSGSAHSDGFRILRRQLNRERVLAARDRALRLALEMGWLDPEAPVALGRPRPGFTLERPDDPDYVRFLQRLYQDPVFEALRSDPGLQQAFDGLGAGAFRHIPADVCRVVPPAASPTPPHQDSHYLGRYPHFWIAWLPLGDCTRAMGPIAVARASHLAGVQPHARDPLGRDVVTGAQRLDWICTDLECGDLILFHNHAIHKALPNRSDRIRLSVDFRFGVRAP
ncbi:MAG: hypothetical protein Kow006_02390 [Gammaproteobacteria bacterium]